MRRSPSLERKRSSTGSARGFTLIEVMIAVALLATGLGAVLVHYSTLQEQRKATTQRSIAQDVLRQLTERISTANAWDLGDPIPTGSPAAIKLPWSLARFEDPTVVSDRDPMTENAPLPGDDLRLLGVIQRPTGLDQIVVFVEYYRGVRVRTASGLLVPGPTNAGAIDGDADGDGVNDEFLAPGDYRARFSDVAWRRDRMLDPTRKPCEQIGDNEPFLIRVLVVYNLTQRLECFCVKQRVKLE
jgi:prepilin-type N-terminal cleavage/methylation domain-containing protein